MFAQICLYNSTSEHKAAKDLHTCGGDHYDWTGNQPTAPSQQQAAVQKSTVMHAVLSDQPDLFHEDSNLKIDQQFNSAAGYVIK